MQVVVECPCCKGSGDCQICRGDGFCVARLWTQLDQLAKIESPKAPKKEAQPKAQLDLAAWSGAPEDAHWACVPLPRGWRMRKSEKHGMAAVRDNVRVIAVPHGKKPRYRVEVKDLLARAWVPVRAERSDRVILTRVLSWAYEVALPLVAEPQTPEARAVTRVSLWLTANRRTLVAAPHPKDYYHRGGYRLVDWVTWRLQNRPFALDAVRNHVTAVTGLAMPPMPRVRGEEAQWQAARQLLAAIR